MSVPTEKYQQLVLDDLINYTGLSHPVKASLAERLLVRRTKLEKLHPNPDDEFSDSSIGPNYEIIARYASEIRENVAREMKPYMEPLAVEKMSTGGYMILNGHHRWFAVHFTDLKKIPIEIANVIPQEEILSRLQNSDKNMCVSFDLDEVLLTDRSEIRGEDEPFFFRWMFRKTLRKNTAALTRQLRRYGFDVWIYTGSSYSEKYLRRLFSLHRAEVDGMINCMFRKKADSSLRESFRRKYAYSVHIDNEGITWVNTATREFDCIDLRNGNEGWAAEALGRIRRLDFVQKSRG